MVALPDDPPAADQIEVSLFGPGIGESIVVHLGLGQWAVVDSCLNASTGNPIALDYLGGLGVDVGRDVKLVVATHWHDDHIRGLGRVINLAASCQFGCSLALQNREFFKLVATASAIKLVEHSSGLGEFEQILTLLNDRSATRGVTGPDIWAQEGMPMLPGAAATVTALSPSAHCVTSALGQFASMLPTEDKPLKCFQTVSPNHSSVVLKIDYPAGSILLGGDLEVGTNNKTGWRAVVRSPHHGNQRSSGFKIAHHGSQNGDHQPVWDNLLSPEVVAMVAPYGKGRKPLPAEEDVARIRRHPGTAYSTVWPPRKKPRRRSELEGEINQILKNRSTVRDVPGQVRLRFHRTTPGSRPSVDLFNGGVDLASI